MTIAERLRSGKQLGPFRGLPTDILLMALLVLASLGSFGLGVVAGKESRGADGERLWIEKLERTEALPEASPTPAPVKKVATAAAGGQLVASKTGTKYYLPWCGSVKRIKEENKVWFASKAEAEAAGYEPAKNCKGL